MSSSTSSATAPRLRAAGLRVTGARCAVLEALDASSDPMTAGTLAQQLRDGGLAIDLVTVYRTLDLLVGTGLLMRVDRMDEGWRYAPCSRHCHSIICRACGRSATLNRCEMAQLDRSVERSTGFSAITHTLQFAGICPDCTKESDG